MISNSTSHPLTRLVPEENLDGALLEPRIMHTQTWEMLIDLIEGAQCLWLVLLGIVQVVGDQEDVEEWVL